MRPHRWAAGLALLLVVSSCAAPHTGLGTRASTCFKALPEAKAAVHGQGRLLGIRLSTAARIEHLGHRLPGGVTAASLPGGPGNPARALCVIGFVGQYRPQLVTSPAGVQSGRFAIVVLPPNGDGGVRTFLTNRLPEPFRHLL